MVKASASQLGGRRFESRWDSADTAGWLATSYLNNGTDCLPVGPLALGPGIWGNDLCKLGCLISRIPAGLSIGDGTIIKQTLLYFLQFTL